MANLYVKKFDMINPFVVASSPATQGEKNVLKIAKSRPGAIVLRNFGHGAGGGSFIGPDANSMYTGKQAFHSHGIGTRISDPVDTLEKYCEEVRKIKAKMDSDIKLWVSVGHYSDIVKGGNWEKDWINQAKELQNAGADAIELHFNTPGVATAKNRSFNYYQLISNCTKMMKKAVPGMPIMVKLAVEGCDPFTSIRVATEAGADSVGPTARWKAFYFDLDWRGTQARPGGGYGGTQATPIVCYSIVETRNAGIKTPMYAGGGVFSYEQAARIIMSGSELVQIGTLACAGGAAACTKMIKDLDKWMDDNGYADMDSLCGDALKLFNMSSEIANERTDLVGKAYKEAPVVEDKCIACDRCVDVCWHEGIEMIDGKARKTDLCIGCGYCFQVCPTQALDVDASGILASVFHKHNI
ncbi:MAG TPA: 4Fe-4S binding protein [Thermoclostridium sp.]|nr:4Fe-4S binding protein [Thermoclostridium sp.]